ncbi:MAG TPA: hypothetical protein VGL08_10160 [Paraburkholderia sp.]|jgi:hypothetical protein
MLPSFHMEIVNEYGAGESLLLSIGGEHVLLDANELDALIEQLSAERSDITPYANAEPSRTHQYIVETDPHWQTVDNPLLDGLIVFLRHSGYGWTGFGIPRHSIAELADFMTSFDAPVRMPEPLASQADR